MSPERLRLILVASTVGILIAVGTFMKNEQPPLPMIAVAPQDRGPARPEPGGEVQSQTTMAPPSVTFSRHMPKGLGTQIVNGGGTINMEVVKVAVPGPLGKVEYLPGTDERAVKYLAQVQAAREEVVSDPGPKDVSTSKTPSGWRTAGVGPRTVEVAVKP